MEDDDDEEQDDDVVGYQTLITRLEQQKVTTLLTSFLHWREDLSNGFLNAKSLMAGGVDKVPYVTEHECGLQGLSPSQFISIRTTCKNYLANILKQYEDLETEISQMNQEYLSNNRQLKKVRQDIADAIEITSLQIDYIKLIKVILETKGTENNE